jgi:hypothetical protein
MDTSKFVNHFNLSFNCQAAIVDDWHGEEVTRHIHQLPNQDIAIDTFDNLIPSGIVGFILRDLEANRWQGVGLDGRASDTLNAIGNYRLSNWNPDLAERLWTRLQGHMADVVICTAESPTDHDNHARWAPVGVSPLFRYIRYAEGGSLVAHYDETFRESDDRRTLMSLVIYLTTNDHGATRMIRDPQVGLPMSAYDFADWTRSGLEEEVILRITPRRGRALMFPHRLLHDSEPLEASDPQKIIIRTDIMFQRV